MIRLLGSLKSGVKPPHSKERLKSLECAGLAALWSAATLSLTAEYSSPNGSSYPRAQQFIAGEGGERFAIRRTFFIKLSYLLRRSLELSGAERGPQPSISAGVPYSLGWKIYEGRE